MAAMRGGSWPLPAGARLLRLEGATAGAEKSGGGDGSRDGGRGGVPEGEGEGEMVQWKQDRVMFWELLSLQIEGLTGVAPVREGPDLDQVRVVLWSPRGRALPDSTATGRDV